MQNDVIIGTERVNLHSIHVYTLFIIDTYTPLSLFLLQLPLEI